MGIAFFIETPEFSNTMAGNGSRNFKMFSLFGAGALLHSLCGLYLRIVNLSPFRALQN